MNYSDIEDAGEALGRCIRKVYENNIGKKVLTVAVLLVLHYTHYRVGCFLLQLIYAWLKK